MGWGEAEAGFKSRLSDSGGPAHKYCMHTHTCVCIYMCTSVHTHRHQRVSSKQHLEEEDYPTQSSVNHV